jgi:hypothetical protein
MSSGKIAELSLRAVALSIVCAIICYMLFVLAMWVVAIVQIAIFIFVTIAEGWPVG